nr:alpha/beta hydrolase [Sphingopyxis sp. BSNA05]
MAALALRIANQGFPVLRYDRRGIGESSGDNQGFRGSAAEIAAAVQYLRQTQPHVKSVLAFGNCDAATALALFGPEAGLDGYILANPWVIEASNEPDTAEPTMSAGAIRARYWDRIKIRKRSSISYPERSISENCSKVLNRPPERKKIARFPCACATRSPPWKRIH